MRPLVWIDPDREHHEPPDIPPDKETPRWASLKWVMPILFRATPQPSTDERSVRSKANSVTRATGHSRDHPPAPGTVRAPISARIRLSFRAIGATHESSRARRRETRDVPFRACFGED